MGYDDDNVFARILRREIPADVVHEDDQCLAFRDVDPKAPVHVLLVPKRPIAMLADATAADDAALGRMLRTACAVAQQEGLEESGFRVVINNGAGAGQSVFHLHMHVLGGRALGWPPG